MIKDDPDRSGEAGSPSGPTGIAPALGQQNSKARQQSFGKRLQLRITRFFSRYVFSSLTQRIIFLNMAALVVLLAGIVFLNQFRDSLIETRVESLLTQGEIIAGAIAAQATVDTDAITIDPDRLLELQAGESAVPMQSETESLDFPINPEQVAPVLRRLISPTRTRARIYDRDGIIILDSLRLYSRGQILRYDLPAVAKKEKGWASRTWATFKHWFWQRDLPLYTEAVDGNGTAYSEVVTALTGGPASETRRTNRGDTIVSVAVPIQRFRAVLGVLLLSTEAGDVDSIIEKERFAIVRTFGVAAAVSALLSIILASTIASPLRRLSAAAQRVRLGVRRREEIPDFGDRGDEIGNLSTSLREMTESLYARIEAIESFAADVSHELKNPLTSLRSAVEILPMVKTDEQRARLLSVIEHDVRRLDRLISDISDASRLDAELAREAAEKIDLVSLLESYLDTYRNMAQNAENTMPQVTLSIAGKSIAVTGPSAQGAARGLAANENRQPQATRKPRTPARRNSATTKIMVAGHKGRLGQVLTNLVDNARSFVPASTGRIEISLDQVGQFAQIRVEDNGPGIPEENRVRIFERFYTDRPGSEAFGQNSGLGLSITKQIVEAHGGTITAGKAAEKGDGTGGGALFVVKLPLLKPKAA